ncbi:unnamed protein product, partial [Didymodactylos carnosus]
NDKHQISHTSAADLDDLADVDRKIADLGNADHNARRGRRNATTPAEFIGMRDHFGIHTIPDLDRAAVSYDRDGNFSSQTC